MPRMSPWEDSPWASWTSSGTRPSASPTRRRRRWPPRRRTPRRRHGDDSGRPHGRHGRSHEGHEGHPKRGHHHNQ
ncbi:hypothetical protein ACFQVA_25605 [Actinomadura keratinilytica]